MCQSAARPADCKIAASPAGGEIAAHPAGAAEPLSPAQAGRHATARPAGVGERDAPHPPIHAAAARGEDGSIAVMLANDSDEEVPFTLELAAVPSSTGARAFTSGGAAVPSRIRCRITDEHRTDAEAPLPAALPPRSFAVLLA